MRMIDYLLLSLLLPIYFVPQYLLFFLSYLQMEPKDRPNAYKDAVFASPHKFIGGPGSAGILIAKRELFDPFDAPSVPGGGKKKNPSRIQRLYSRLVNFFLLNFFSFLVSI